MMRSRYPSGYRPGQSRRRPPPPSAAARRPHSPKERLAFYRLDARGHRQLTHFAYLAIGVGLVNLIAAAALVVWLNQDLRQATGVFIARAAGVPQTRPIGWRVHLAEAPDGHRYYAVSPPEVADRVRQDFAEAWRWYYASETFPDANAAGQYFTGGYLQAVRFGLDYYAEQGYYADWQVVDFEWLGDVEFSADGSRATVSANLRGPFEIHQMSAAQAGVQLQSLTRPAWTLKTSMTWNAAAGRWLAYDDVSGEPPGTAAKAP